MQTVVVTGGTDGLGRGLALHYLDAGARVIVAGSTQQKGDALLEEAEALDAGDRIRFLRVDLTSTAEARRLVAEIESTCVAVDKLVLCAQRYRLLGKRSVTPEGYEHSFALAYLSRFILSYGLREVLEAAARPVIMNVGTPGVSLGKIHWDDLQLERGYNGNKATLQSFRANDLLGVGFGQAWADGKVPYVGYNPGVVSTGMPNALPLPLRLVTKATFAVAATSVGKAIKPMAALLDEPRWEPFTTYWKKNPVDTTRKAFDVADAQRLKILTEKMIGG